MRVSGAVEAAIEALYAAYADAQQPFHQFVVEVQNESQQFRYRFEFGRLPPTKENAAQKTMAGRFEQFAAPHGNAPSVASASPGEPSAELTNSVIQLLTSCMKKAAGATSETRLVEDMHLTGAEIIEMRMFIEDEFGVELPTSSGPADYGAMNAWMKAPIGANDVGPLRTIGDIVAYVHERV